MLEILIIHNDLFFKNKMITARFVNLQRAVFGISILSGALAETIANGTFGLVEQGLTYFHNLHNDTIAGSMDS